MPKTQAGKWFQSKKGHDRIHVYCGKAFRYETQPTLNLWNTTKLKTQKRTGIALL